MRKRTKRALAASGLLLAGLATWLCWGTPRTEPAYIGSSAGLHHTAVMVTADEPIPQGQNAIWCDTTTAAWAKLRDANGGTMTLTGAEELSLRLSAAADTPAPVPDGSLRVGAGQLAAFAKPLKDLPGKATQQLASDVAKAPPGSLGWWAHLSATVKFPEPYEQIDRPLMFGDRVGRAVRSFGIRHTDDSRTEAQRKQVRVLFDPEMLKTAPSTAPSEPECALDLCQNSDASQVVVARIARPASLAEGVAYVQGKAADCDRPELAKLHQLDKYETLQVPDIVFEIDHRFADLEGKPIAAGVYKGLPLDMARQVISFRLDRSGASMDSLLLLEAACDARDFTFYTPFLVYMCKRGEKRPYFAMWVDNPELLSAWD